MYRYVVGLFIGFVMGGIVMHWLWSCFEVNKKDTSDIDKLKSKMYLNKKDGVNLD